MAISVLSDLNRELGRLSAAGVKLAAGDFRLKNLIPALRQAGQSAPVFSKLAQLSEGVVNARPESLIIAFLELSTLACAVSYTAGETETDEGLVAIEPPDFDLPASMSYRKLTQMKSLLSQNGAGRTRQLSELFAQNLEKDARLLPLLIDALGDYHEVADLAQAELRKYAPEMHKYLPGKINAAIEENDKRLLRLLQVFSSIPGTDIREFLLRALAEGNPDTKIAAIQIIAQTSVKDGVELLKPFLEHKNKQVKDEAEQALKSLKQNPLAKLFKRITKQ